jgi:hypothetical protein
MIDFSQPESVDRLVSMLVDRLAEKMNPGTLGREAAAKFLSIDKRQLDKFASDGKVPRIKLGDKTVFRVADLEKLLDSHVEPLQLDEFGNPVKRVRRGVKKKA